MHIQHPTQIRQSKPRAGFTLVELIVVVLIMGVLTTVAMPSITTALSQYRAEATARRIMADINYARTDAMTRGQNRTVSFATGTDSYTIAGLADPNDPNSTSYDTNLANTGYPATLTAASFNASPDLTFNIYGQPLGGGSPLTANGTVSISSGSEARTVVVDQVTGKATVQ